MTFEIYCQLMDDLENKTMSTIHANDVEIKLQDVKRILIIKTLRNEMFEKVLSKVLSINPEIEIYLLMDESEKEIAAQYGIGEKNVYIHNGRFFEQEGTNFSDIISDNYIDAVMFGCYRRFKPTYLNVMGFCSNLTKQFNVQTYSYIANEDTFVYYDKMVDFYTNFAAFSKMLELGVRYYSQDSFV